MFIIKYYYFKNSEVSVETIIEKMLEQMSIELKEYKKIAEVTDVLSYKDKTAKKSSKYYYTVAAMNGKYQGSYESGLKVN